MRLAAMVCDIIKRVRWLGEAYNDVVELVSLPGRTIVGPESEGMPVQVLVSCSVWCGWQAGSRRSAWSSCWALVAD